MLIEQGGSAHTIKTVYSVHGGGSTSGGREKFDVDLASWGTCLSEELQPQTCHYTVFVSHLDTAGQSLTPVFQIVSSSRQVDCRSGGMECGEDSSAEEGSRVLQWP